MSMDYPVDRATARSNELPGNFKTVLQRELILRWARAQARNPELTHEEAEPYAIPWLIDEGYAALFADLYAQRLAASQWRPDDVSNEAVLRDIQADLEASRHKKAA